MGITNTREEEVMSTFTFTRRKNTSYFIDEGIKNSSLSGAWETLFPLIDPIDR